MLGLKKLCFVCARQRCFKSEEMPSDFTMNLSSLPPSKGGGSVYLPTAISPPRLSDAQQFRRLHLRVTEGEHLTVGLVYQIDFEGLRGSSRFKRDGRTYAGYDEQANDIILPKDEFGIGSVHFVIEFNSMTGLYMIKDQGDGTGTFVKLSRPLLLQSYYILSFGNTHMTVILSPPHQNKSKLTVKFIEGSKAGESFVFESHSEVIKIGRMADCTIQFEDTSLSRYQCVLQFKGDGWYVSDGDGEKPSTNGTWLFLDDYFPIETDMVLKAGMTLFQVEPT